MNKRFFNQQNLTRRLRLLPVLFAMLLMPLSGWALDSYLGINTTNKGSHGITDATATDVLEDGSQKITYDAASNILTLNSVDLSLIDDSGLAFIAMVDGDLQSLTVRLIGENKLTLGGLTYLFYGTNVSFITSATASGSLTITTADGWEGLLFDEYYTNNGVGVAYCDKLHMVHTDGQSTYTIQTVEPTGTSYGLTVAGTPVTSGNATDILGNGKVTYDQENSKLTFTDRNYINYPGHCINTTESLEIDVETGGNLFLNSTGDGNYPFYSANDVTISFDAYFPGTINGKNRKLFSEKCDYHFGYAASNGGTNSSNNYAAGPTLYFDESKYTIKKCTYQWDVNIHDNYIYNENSEDFFGDGSVSVTEENSETIKVTLNDANFKGPLTADNYKTFIIDLTGVNYIKNTDESAKAIYRLYGEPGLLTFTGDGELRLKDVTIDDVDDVFAMDESLNPFNYSANFTTGGWSKEYVTTGENAPYLRIYKGSSTSYGLTVGGVAVTSANASNITGGQISVSEGGKVSYDSENKVLTLKGATIDMSNVAQYPIQSSLANLTIKLERDNTVNLNEDAPFFVYFTGVALETTPTLAFDTEYYYHTTDGGYKLGTLTINNAAEIGLIASGYNFDDLDASEEYIDPDLAGNATTGWKVSQSPSTATVPYVKIWKLEVFDLWIGSGRVLSTAWEAGQSGGPKYNPVTKRLEVSEDGTAFPVKSSMAELVVEIDGDCAIAPTSSSYAISFQEKGEVTSGTLKFVKAADANMASITLTANGENQSSEPYKAIEGFAVDDIIITDPLALKDPASMSDILNATTVKIANYNEAYDIRIAGTTVTDANKDDVFDDGTVSLTVSGGQAAAPTYTLTLNNASIIPEREDAGIAYMGETGLTIRLIGTNTVKGIGGCPAIAYYGQLETVPSLTFTKGDEQACSVELEAVGETAIDAFTINHDGLFMLNDSRVESETLISTTTITSTLFGGGSGTAADPIIIKTTDDLMNFSKLVNNGTINTAAMYFRLAPEGGTLDCSGLSESEYKPIGSGSQPFKGTFSGNGCTISNLIAYEGGLFGNISGATIEDLNLSNCTIAGNDYCIAGLATDASNGSTINLCTITNSTIECLSNQYDPTVGGIVARLSGSETTISNCVVNNTLIKAETTNGTSGIAGGIVGEATSGKIENCHIKGESKITDYNNAGATLYAGAIVGKYDGEYTTLSGNDYYYDVTVETRKGTDAANKETKDGYTQRAIGNGDSDVDGAVMYTKKVTFPTVTGVTITKDGDYYSYDATGINVAPGQTAKMIVEPSAAVKSFTATNVDDTAITSEALAGNKTRYSFEMPDAAVAVTLTMKEDPNLQFVYTWTRLRIGETFSQEVKSDMPTAPAVTWSSSNEAVATVDPTTGVVTPVAPSNSDIEITATFAGDDTYAPATASYAVRVEQGKNYLSIKYKDKDLPLAKVRVKKGKTLNIKENYNLICPAEIAGDLTWTPDASTIATAADGVVSGVSCGNTRIVVAFAGNDNYEADYCEFYVDVAPLAPTIELETGTYLSTHAPITITKENIEGTSISYTWDDITGDNVAGWNDYTDAGVVIQGGTLSARVGYYDAENYNTIYSDTVSVAYTVFVDPEMQFIQNDEPVDAAEYIIGAASNPALPTLDNPNNVAVTYASNNTDVATVAADGTVTVVGIGEATITATSAATDVYAAGEASYTLTVKRQLNVSFSTSNEWATYYGSENLATPTGLKAYQVTAVEGATVTISEIDYIPANTAVLLQNVSNNNTWSNIPASAYTGATLTFASNKLIGTASDVDVSTISGGTVYVLYNNMFKRATGGTIPANRGYLVVEPSAVNAGNAPQLSISIGDENTTAISNTDFTDNTDKANEWYSIDGVKLNGQPQKPGLYIKNGKKVFINKK